MVTLRFRRAAVAVLLCAAPAFADRLLTFEGTQFRANLAYNADDNGSSSEPPAQPSGQSLDFVHEIDPNDNQMIYPNDQMWGVVTRQDPPPPGTADPLTIEFEFQQSFATAIEAYSPLTIGLEALNCLGGLQPLGVSGSVWLDVAIGVNFMGETELSATDWIWQETPGSPTEEFDLTIALDDQWGDLFQLEADDVISKVKVTFDVTVPEPPTFVLMAASIALCWRRRPR